MGAVKKEQRFLRLRGIGPLFIVLPFHSLVTIPTALSRLFFLNFIKNGCALFNIVPQCTEHTARNWSLTWIY
jgi:hypothetical protein